MVAPPENRLRCEDWVAHHDLGPGRTPTLRVRGRCTAPTAGFRLALVRQAPQGSNPRDLLLRLEVEEPEFAAEVITEHEVTYEEATVGPYDTVTILPDGATIEVELVS